MEGAAGRVTAGTEARQERKGGRLQESPLGAKVEVSLLSDQQGGWEGPETGEQRDHIHGRQSQHEPLL